MTLIHKIKYTHIINTLFALLCIVLIIPIAWSILYSVFLADDFSVAYSMTTQTKEYGNALSGAIYYTIGVYNQWEGAFFSDFMEAILNPLIWGGEKNLSITMLSIFFIFIFSLFFLLYVVYVDIISIEKYYFFPIFFLFLFATIEYNPYSENFYWFDGSIHYTLPFSLMLYSFGFLLKYNHTQKNIYLTLASILGFFATGGKLMVAGATCYIGLVLCLYALFKHNACFKNNIIAFIIWFIGAILGTIAPGNFVRHDYIDNTGMHPIRAMYDALRMVGYRVENFIFKTNFTIILALLLLLGILIGRTHVLCYKKRAIVLISLLLATPLISTFPLALGYASQDTPDRSKFIIDILIILSAGLFVMIIGEIIGNFIDKRARIITYTLILFYVIVVSSINEYRISNTVSYTNYLGLKNETYSNYHKKCFDIYKQLDEAESGSNVIIKLNDYPTPVDSICAFQMSSDDADWINQSLERYYNLNDVKLEKIDK